MDIAAEQCVAIKYCIHHYKMEIETLSELKEAYGDECLAKSMVLKWHAIFMKDCFSPKKKKKEKHKF